MMTRWASWRRDLLFTLAGALVASAVLVPLGWSQVRAERQRAEAAEQQAELALSEKEEARRAEAAALEAERNAVVRALLASIRQP